MYNLNSFGEMYNYHYPNQYIINNAIKNDNNHNNQQQETAMEHETIELINSRILRVL